MLIIIPSSLAFVFNATENLQTQWDVYNGSPDISFHFTFNPLGH